MKPLLLTLSTLLTMILATGAVAHADPQRRAKRSAPSPTKVGADGTKGVAEDWDSVEGSFESDGSQIFISVDRGQRQAWLIRNAGTPNPVRYAPQELSPAFMGRLGTAIKKSRVVTSSGLVVGRDTKVESETLRGLLESAAFTVEERAEPTEEKVSGKIVETDTGLYLYGKEERFLLRGLRPGLEKAAAALSEGTLQVLRWPAKTLGASIEPTKAMIVGIYLEATKESLPQGVKPGDSVKVVGVQHSRRGSQRGSRRAGGPILKVQDKKGRVGYLMNPGQAAPLKPAPVKPQTVKPRPVKPQTVKPRPVKPQTVKPRPIKKGLKQALAETKPTDSKSD